MSESTSRSVVITGAASGIGEHTARAFAAEGARVVVADRDKDRGDAVTQSIREAGGEAVFVPCDVTSYEDVGRAIETACDMWGGLDVLVNNAGIAPPGDTILELEPHQFDEIVNINLRGAFFGIKHAVPKMIARGGGSIVSTSSIGALPGILGGVAYGASKAALLRLTMEVASLHGTDGIRANAVLPGLTLTPMVESRTPGMTDDERRNLLAGMQPVRGTIEPRHIADAIVWLSSDAAAYVSGQTLTIDGAMMVAGWGGRGNSDTN